MSSIQTTIKFPVTKRSLFYGINKTSKHDFTNATTRCTPSSERYVSSVKKIMTISSSESDSDSDTENLKKLRKKIVEEPKTPRTSKRNKNKSENKGNINITPPKQRKLTPSKTPSTLLNDLHLKSPSERRDHLAPKKLFSEKYQSARKALHSAITENLIGRESEFTELSSFIRDHLQCQSSGSLYISGPPGTGKTASLSKIMLQPEFKSAFNIVFVNCTSIKSAGAIYKEILQKLNIPIPKSEKFSKITIEKYLIESKKMTLLVLDEIDQLDSKRQTVLYSIFEWPSISNSKLLLIGIANALDLTDRILPRLQARCELKPKLIHFAPYSKEQITNIITTRLQEANVSDVFTGMAVQLLAAKVAAISGDIRKALDLSRRVIELAEKQKNLNEVLQPAIDNIKNGASPKKQSPLTEKPVELKEVCAVLNGVYGGTQNLDQREDTFPLQQKLLLCSLILILNKGRNKDITITKLYEVYKKVCKKRNIHILDISEFFGLCSLIETRGILRVIGKKEARFCKVALQWDQEELGVALQDKNMMAEIINDVTCL